MKFATVSPKIIVVGSSSIDLVLNTEKYPQQNETVMAYKSESFFGGKGANQAVGTSRLGASTYFIGCVGMDSFGQQIMRNLVDEGVNVGFVAETEEVSTGTAYVTAAEGENTIIVVPAANSKLKPSQVDLAEKYFNTADLVLTQLEIPMEVVEHTVKLAKQKGMKVGIYATPARKLSRDVVEVATFIIAKKNEISTVFGDDEDRDELLRKYPNKIFVRDDTNSTTYFNGKEMCYYRNDHDADIHKMGMGDAFTSGFAIALCNGNTIEDCVKFGNDVSMRVSKKRGSQKGLPYLKEMKY